MAARMELVIERLGHRGDGVAPGPVYVPRALPGEVVTGDVRDGRLPDARIVTPSPERVAPPCPHYRRCGGCALQHASDAFVAEWKAGVVARALAAQRLEAPVAGVVTSPPQSRRRAVLAGRRTRGGALVGFHARASDTIVPIPDCRLLHPDLMAALPALEALTRLGATRKSEVTLFVGQSVAGCDVAVGGARPADPALRAELAALAEAHGLARLTWNDETVALLAPPVRRFDGIDVVPPPGAFPQATAHAEAALLRAARDATEGAQRVVDLFAGSGTFALPLARTAEVHAVEGEAAALAALEGAWRKAEGLKRVTVERRDLFRHPLDAAELAGFDAAVIDPPRAGAEAQARVLAASGPDRLAFVSCNPATFARDARLLVDGGYRLGPILVIDQFRWSPHVELFAPFTRV